MRLEGLGDDCGTNPCGLWDWIYTRDACLTYLGCADPTDPRYIGATQGGVTAVGAAAGGAVNEAATGIGIGLTQNVTGNIVLIGAALLAGLFWWNSR